MIGQLPNVDLAFWLVATVWFVLLSGFFSGAETGLYCVNPLRLRLAAHRGSRSAGVMLRLASDEPGLLFVTLVGTNAANYLAPVCATVICVKSGLSDEWAEFYTTLILTPVVFIFGEIVPKNLFQRQADRLMPRAARILSVSAGVFRLTGALWLQKRLTGFVLNCLSQAHETPVTYRPRLKMYQMLREGAADGALTPAQVVMLERVGAFRSMKVESVMAARSETVMLPEDATRRDLERLARDGSHSRIPVFRKNRRHIVGIIHVLDVLTADGDVPVASHMREPVTVAFDATVHDVLALLQRRRRRMAVVLSKKGHCVGIVTVKDLVEEIVGEIAVW